MRTGRPFVVKTNSSLLKSTENVIYLSTANQGSRANFIKIEPCFKDNLSTCYSDFVYYPVKYVKELNENEIYVPRHIRSYLGFAFNQEVQAELVNVVKRDVNAIDAVSLSIEKILKGRFPQTVDAHEIAPAIAKELSNHLFKFDQLLSVPYKNCELLLRVQGVEADGVELNKADVTFGMLHELTDIRLTNAIPHWFELKNAYSPANQSRQLSEIPLDFVGLGVGGHKKEIQQVIRRLFYSHALSQGLRDAYGIKKHAKGVLLYGPPGTGKTLIAKAITSLFTDKAIKIIEGPQLKSSYYGASQQNVANVFKDAYENPNDLFVYFFDELDSLAPQRGTDNSVSTSNNTDIVSRLLSILDGPNSPENIIVIAATNRKELIDEALLRPGRLGMHVYIGLPDELGRLEILQVHTKEMTRTLSNNVDLADIARRTKNYSGAELAQVVDVARGFAIGGNFTDKDNTLTLKPDLKNIDQAQKVTQDHFLRAIQEVRPAFGVDEKALAYDESKFISYSEELAQIIDEFSLSLDMLRFDKDISQMNFLITGAAGTGKSMLAMHLAKLSNCPHLQVLTADMLVSLSLSEQIAKLDEVFAKARQSVEPSVIVLDGLENLIETLPDYSHFNNKLRVKLELLLKATAAHDSNVLVLATANSKQFLQKIKLADYFQEQAELNVVRLNCKDVKKVGTVVRAFCDKLGFALSNDLTEKEAGIDVSLPVGKLVYYLKRHVAAASGVNKVSLSEFINQLSDKVRPRMMQEVPLPNDAANLTRNNMFNRNI